MEDRQEPQLFVPARPDQVNSHAPITIYLQQPPHRPFPWVPVLLTVFLFFALVFVVRLAVVSYLVKQDQKLMHNISVVPPMASPVYPAGTSAKYPPSRTLRLTGTVDMGSFRYVAQGPASTFVMIPADDCRLVSGSPVCHFQGKSVTRFTGVSPAIQ